MIHVANKIWIGDSHSEKNVLALGIQSILNVATDLHGKIGWCHGVEYMQVGLVDGPGNHLTAYYAAVLALADLLRRGPVLVFCHTGGRSLAVTMMYLKVKTERDWNELLEMLQERVEVNLPMPHEAHKEAFSKMDWGLLMEAIG